MNKNIVFEIDWQRVIMTVFTSGSLRNMSLYSLHNVILTVSLKSDTKKYVRWISILNLHVNTLLIFSHTAIGTYNTMLQNLAMPLITLMD